MSGDEAKSRKTHVIFEVFNQIKKNDSPNFTSILDIKKNSFVLNRSTILFRFVFFVVKGQLFSKFHLKRKESESLIT